jgi:uncharacterized cysteine cluster protein YcgN (CxxCxxCC family)
VFCSFLHCHIKLTGGSLPKFYWIPRNAAVFKLDAGSNLNPLLTLFPVLTEATKNKQKKILTRVLLVLTVEKLMD